MYIYDSPHVFLPIFGAEKSHPEKPWASPAPQSFFWLTFLRAGGLPPSRNLPMESWRYHRMCKDDFTYIYIICILYV